MARKQLGLTKTTVRLFAEDVDTLNRFYPNTGYNEVLRRLVHIHCTELRARLDQQAPATPVEVKLNGE